MRINKETRKKVWLKYDKHCAYCGKEIEYKEMQIDHLVPKGRNYPISKDLNGKYVYPDIDKFDNLMPSCYRCNHYKRANTLEVYRFMIKTIHEKVLKQYVAKVAADYGILTIHTFSGQFYFEKFNQ